MTIESPPSDPRSAESLRGLCDGAVHLPGDPGYDAARLPWNVALDQRPAAVALPRTVAEVRQVVRAAAAAGLRVAPQSTGHNAGPLVAQGLDDVVVAAHLGDARRDHRPDAPASPASRAAPCGSTPTEPAGDHGLAALHGSSPDVGIAGYSPRRRHRLVRPQARPRHQQPAPRSSWSPPTASTCAPTPPRTASSSGRCAAAAATSASSRRWSSASTPSRRRMRACSSGTATTPSRVLRRWADWAPEAPDEVTTAFRLPQPAAAARDPGAAARSLGSSSSTVPCSAATREARGDPRRRCGRSPRRSTPSTACRPASLVRLHMDPEGPTPAVSDGDAARRARRRQRSTPCSSRSARARRPSLLVAELRQLGGALGRAPRGRRRARDGSTAAFVAFGVGDRGHAGDGGAGCSTTPTG